MISGTTKKIIIIGPAHPYRGGNALFVAHLYEALRKNFNVKIYNYKLLYPSFLFPGRTQFDISKEKIADVPSERFINSINPINWIKVARKLKAEKADLIIFDWWHPFFGICHGVISFLLKRKYRNSILFITENVVSHEDNFVDKFLTGFGLRNASKFLVLSDVVENDVKTYSKRKKIYRSELPVYDCYRKEKDSDTKNIKEELGIESDSIVFLFFGYVRRYKGLDILIEAFPKILKEIPKARLLIVGEFYDNPAPYFQQIKKLKIEEQSIIINKYVPNEDVAKYYQVSDLVILPYRGATQSGILNLAYGFNKPVVVTDVGGLADFVNEGKTGFVVKPNSADEIVKGVMKFINTRKDVEFAIHIEKMNTENRFNQLPKVFEEILADSK